MRYTNTVKGIFVSRPNRFIANVLVDGEMTVCHVKNTGRCRELLTDGVVVILTKCDHPHRKTKYDLIAVYKGDKLINIDSQAPNALFREWVENSDLFGNLTLVKSEQFYQNSRFDFYLESDERNIFVEVKGVTLEEDGIVKFPDAPTERGVKHLNELMRAVDDGYEAYIVFVVQMKGCHYFTPNVKTHPEFAVTLKKAINNCVKAVAFECEVHEDEVKITDFVEIIL